MPKNENLVKCLVDKHSTSRSSLIPILQGIVEEEKYLSEDAMLEVAELMDIAAADIYGTASFYSFLNTKKLGKNIIRVCKNISCQVSGKNEIIEVLEDMLNIKVGETTSDNNFTLLHGNCMGWCDKGPAMMINDDVFIQLTPEKAISIINEYKK